MNIKSSLSSNDPCTYSNRKSESDEFHLTGISHSESEQSDPKFLHGNVKHTCSAQVLAGSIAVQRDIVLSRFVHLGYRQSWLIEGTK